MIHSTRFTSVLYSLALAPLFLMTAENSFAAAATVTISGSPPTAVTAGTNYTFSPAATGGRFGLRFFTIKGKPSWASFSWRTGTLSGKPGASQVGNYSGIVIAVTDGRSTARLPAFAIAVRAASTTPTPTPGGGTTTPPTGTTNRAPAISGTPSASVTVGNAYAFKPSASDPDGDALTFTIQSKPAWASFSPTTGQLSGTPAAANVGTHSGISIMASDGKVVTALPSFSIQVLPAASTSNSAPKISGTPATSATVGQSYRFQPVGSDPDGDTIAYGIANKPAWATFSTTTGALTGTPTATDVGTTANIVIAASDGKSNASLAPFSIVVKSGTTGSATLSWSAPTKNTDGTALTNLAGYRIQYGTSPSALNQVVTIDNPTTTTYVVPNLSAGTWYFALTTLTTSGQTSNPTDAVAKSIQ